MVTFWGQVAGHPAARVVCAAPICSFCTADSGSNVFQGKGAQKWQPFSHFPGLSVIPTGL